ncbi:FMN-binding negative transcriptional regulator [Luteolibacter soli]|uniref:FMN-binding negative transcriptional regulator n=1 Tax=Luteolibacter soli TaxID=3135280 RepID=A0ABU9AN62_9BACT
MYVPPHFQENRPEVIDEIIAKNPLGTLVYSMSSGLDATHVPFVHRRSDGGDGVLLAHVARKNPIWNEVADGSEVLVIFHGGDAYVSPNWYPSKHETHRLVPTWNYQVVHVRGTIHFTEDAKALRSLVALLTHQQETAAAEPKPWKMGDSEPEYIAGLVAAIIGVEIRITSISAVSKLSQNREERDKAGLVSELLKRGEDELAAEIEKAGKLPGI